MKFKHNKKRNTAFLFECLAKTLTKSVVSGDNDKRSKLLTILKENFKKGTLLYEELQLYKSILDFKNAPKDIAEKVLYEAKRQYGMLPKKRLFEEQTTLIKQINKILSSDVYDTFVPNYRNLATIYQIFNSDLPPRKRVLMEEETVKYMIYEEKEKFHKTTPDNLTLKMFLNKFNTSYGSNLLNEQKALLTKYISSFNDNEVDFKLFLNEELQRLKNKINSYIDDNQQGQLAERCSSVLKVIDTFRENKIDNNMLKQILKIQSLVEELK